MKELNWKSVITTQRRQQREEEQRRHASEPDRNFYYRLDITLGFAFREHRHEILGVGQHVFVLFWFYWSWLVGWLVGHLLLYLKKKMLCFRR